MTAKQTINVRIHLKHASGGREATREELLEAIDAAIGVLDIGTARDDIRYHADVEEGKVSMASLWQELRHHEPGCVDCDRYVAHVRDALGWREK